MVVGRDAVVVSNLGQLLNIVHVVMADVDIEHHRVAVVMLPLDEIIEVRPNRIERFGQRLSFLDRINRQVDSRDASVAQAIDHVRLHQPAVGRQVNEDVFLGAVVNDLVNELWPQQRFATHQRQHARAD